MVIVTTATMPAITMTRTVCSLVARLQTAAFATICPSVKSCMIRSIATLETLLSIAMSGQWPQSNKKTTKMGPSETVFVAYPQEKIPVSRPHDRLYLWISFLTLTVSTGGGSQLSKWFDGSNANGPKKTCSGDMQDGDHWTVEFNLDNVADAT